MAKRKSSAGRWLLIAFSCMLLATVICCCSGAVLIYMSPSLLLNWIVEDEPLTAPTIESSPNIQAKLNKRFKAGGVVTVQCSELVELADPAGSEDIDVFWLECTDDQADLTLSVHLDDPDAPAQGYLNFRARGALTMEHGWFTHLELDILDVGPWELGEYMVGQEMSPDANRSLADQRAQDPKMGQALDQIERLEFTNGALEVELVEGGWEVLRGMGK